ncbi:N-acetylglucosaminidase [Clostridium grantii]|uniref:Mannosyl-glycoprotein endo-beta-N-acetylglucosaminidase n=1 Tax=Clostridium grantii DSM 8605 TaxID=1121316 RepID=A0A1M5QK18_9CLOT|nr:glucosaminidase domain-containing protein [Clostridium grantii]SHH14181.1 mannosyl-glycoprotein endo-beta-N-acetylglucosaminidase [Clostridium grantii DSM 8605]
MNKIFNHIKIISILLLILFISPLTIKQVNSFSIFEEHKSISTLKSWSINFDSEVDFNSINAESVKVTDNNNLTVPVNISLSKNKKTLIVDPPIDSYSPLKEYYVTISNNLKSVTGKALGNPLVMKFTTKGKYEDSSNFSSFPNIKTIKYSQQPIIKNQKIDILINSNSEDYVQYRVFIYKYSNDIFDATYKYGTPNYTEITKGFSPSIKGTSTYAISINEGLSNGKYRVLVYIKNSNDTGKHTSVHTDYDNFTTSYFNVLDKDITENPSLNESYTFTNYNKTLDEIVSNEYSNGAPVQDHDKGIIWLNATSNIISYYMNPKNFLDDYGKYMFLDLRYMEGVLSSDLDNLLKGKGVLEGKGQIFLTAAKTANINPLYLLSHSLLETAHGKSILAKGVLVTSVNGQAVVPRIVYNLFAVGAYDSDPDKLGSEFAYQKGWFSVEEALLGGASYIGSSYINSTKYKQNTLYKMRYNVNVSWHQYSTDIGWAYKQIKNIKYLFDNVTGAKPSFEIPVYN